MSVDEFLSLHEGAISRFVLLDHMDWLCSADHPVLVREWQGIIDHATSRSRIIWRSGGLKTDFVDRVTVNWHGRRCRVGEILQYNTELASTLHQQDRVHTYGSFYIADTGRGDGLNQNQ